MSDHAIADTSAERRARRERRGVARGLYHPERRTGFDRRGWYPVTGLLRERPSLLIMTLVAANLLSMLDLALTWVELQSGLASEGNPLMAQLFEIGPGAAWLFKFVLGVAASLLIWRFRRYRQILAVSVAAFGIYAAVIGYHVLGLHLVGLA